MKTVIIGSVDLLHSHDIELWARSIRSTGYSDDIVLLSYRITDSIGYQSLIEKYNIEVLSFDYDENVSPLNLVGPISGYTQNHIWRMRFFSYVAVLTERTEYTHVINSDVRDVIFQRNPNEILHTINNGVIAPSEGVRMIHEHWNAKSVQDCFGPYVWELAAKDFMIYNCGSWGGSANIIKWLALTIFMMSHQRANPGDQPAFNMLMNGLLKEAGIVQHMGMDDEWACQCALSFEPSRKHLLPLLEHTLPVMGADGLVRNKNNVPYVLVHQYDRVPDWKERIEQRLSV